MSESVMLAIIAFFSAVVTLLTTIIGYFKVFVPSQKAGGQVSMVETAMDAAVSRIAKLESACQEFRAAIEECEKDRVKLHKENYYLLSENAKLRKAIEGRGG